MPSEPKPYWGDEHQPFVKIGTDEKELRDLADAIVRGASIAHAQIADLRALIEAVQRHPNVTLRMPKESDAITDASEVEPTPLVIHGGRVDTCDCSELDIRVTLTASTRFGNEARFDRATLGDETCFERATFGERADFYCATFGDAVLFHEVTFGDEAHFDGATFGKQAYFAGAIFGDEPHFDGATFGEQAIFDGTIFGEQAHCFKVIFAQQASFDRTTFGQQPHFFGATFGYEASFAGATFGDEAQFDGATFGEQAHFDKATFGERASFADVTFGDGACFYRATLGEMVSFADATFSDGARFDGATFGDGASFDGATFGEQGNFREATFGDEASFREAIFGDEASFREATLGAYASFSEATFGDRASFDGATFGDEARLIGATFGDEASFGEATFGDQASLIAATFGDGARFGEATFGERANFFAASLGERASFIRATLGDLASFLECDLNHAAITDAVFDRADLRRTRGVLFDETRIAQVKMEGAAPDPWSKLRRQYTGPWFFVHLILLVIFFAPYVANVLALTAAAKLQENMMQYTDEADEKVKTFRREHPISGRRAVDWTNLRGGLSEVETTFYITRDYLPAVWILIGGHKGWYVVAMAIIVMFYNALRAVLTMQISALRDAEERSNVTPRLDEYYGACHPLNDEDGNTFVAGIRTWLSGMWGKELFTVPNWLRRRLPDDLQKRFSPYQPPSLIASLGLYRVHQFARLIMWIAILATAWNSLEWAKETWLWI